MHVFPGFSNCNVVIWLIADIMSGCIQWMWTSRISLVWLVYALQTKWQSTGLYELSVTVTRPITCAVAMAMTWKGRHKQGVFFLWLVRDRFSQRLCLTDLQSYIWTCVCVCVSLGEGSLFVFVCASRSLSLLTDYRSRMSRVCQCRSAMTVKKCKQWCLHEWHKSATWNVCHLHSVSHQSALHRVGWWAQALLPSVILSLSISVTSCPLIGVFSSLLSFHSSSSSCFDLSVGFPSLQPSIRLPLFGKFCVSFTFISGPSVRLTETDNVVLFCKVPFSVGLNLFWWKVKCHHSFTVMSFQTTMAYFPQWNTKGDVLKKVLITFAMHLV